MQKTVLIVIVVLLFALSACVVVKVNLVSEAEPLEEQVIAGSGKEKILLMDITGVITTEESSTMIGAIRKRGMVALVREQLDLARKDPNVKALVVRINSPGGGVTASDMLYHEIRKFKNDTGSKVVAHFTETGASGGYYAALAADTITAQPTTVTGSIGVTMLRVDATGLMQKIGIDAVHITSGPQKSMGSPFKEMTPEEKKIFQSLINTLYERFLALVVEQRNLAPERARELADGRIYTGPEARDAGLIDGIGYLEDALAAARKMAGLEEATVVAYARPGEYRPNIYSMSMNLLNLDLGELAGPGLKFTYLWMP